MLLHPRETLYFINVEGKEDYFVFGSLPCTTVSLQRLPKKVFAGLMQVLTRSSDIEFPREVSTHFELGDWVVSDDCFERKQPRLKLMCSLTVMEKSHAMPYTYFNLKAVTRAPTRARVRRS
ncbi:MAG: hypothetical protein H0W76_15095 [Pyrinomonadaceae bacterium]|nr:hypothetical protein [Pyrinomonadaceae bacterium]